MTEQTTAERIKEYLECTVSWDNNHGDMEGYDEAAQTIAAELNTKDKKIAELEAENAKLKEANRSLAIEGLSKLIKGVHRSGTGRGQ